MFFFFFFFFSSRRRHTRSLRDWSSDVCSSDLSDGPLGPCRPRSLPERCRSPSSRHASRLRRRRRSEEHTSELQSRRDLVCRLLLEKKKNLEVPPAGLDKKKRRNYKN